MSDIETVHLDGIDGFEFELVCKRMLERAGWGTVERIGGVADGGRDLIIHGKDGKLIVECKHQPDSSIGRPIVQKLHSAVISSGAAGGMIVTTGRYSEEAIQHARLLSNTTPITLFDMPKLTELADAANIRLVSGGTGASIFCYPVIRGEDLKMRMYRKMNGFQSYPTEARDIMRIVPESVVFLSHYIIKANINQDFSTGVGVIHSIHRHDQRFILNAKTGNMLDPLITTFMQESALGVPPRAQMLRIPTSRTGFDLDHTSLKSKAMSQIIEMYTTSVSYVGRNNRLYTKVCRPGEQSVHITDIKQVFIPAYAIKANVMTKEYNCTVIVNDTNAMIVSSDMNVCDTCKGTIDGKGMICNSCGAISHRPGRIRSHAYTCGRCDKTICQNCTYWERRFGIAKRMLCRQCADERPGTPKKLISDA